MTSPHSSKNPAGAGGTLVVKSGWSIVPQPAATVLLEPGNFSKHFRFWFPVTWVLSWKLHWCSSLAPGLATTPTTIPEASPLE